MKKKILQLKKLDKKAQVVRESIISSLLEAGSGHSAGPLGMADVFVALYFSVLNHNPKKPTLDTRDRVILSGGHICPVLYATLAEAGYFSKKELLKLRQLGSVLQGHPHINPKFGIENTAGPLGQGVSFAVGCALAAKMDKKKHYIYCISTDGEQEEGQVWEAAMCAAHHQLDNLIVIIDRNNIQIDGFVDDVMNIDSLSDKYKAFGWHVQEVDGHNIEMIIDACEFAKSMHNQPSVIIAHTIPGKGVDFMENDFAWHGKPPSLAEAKIALKKIRTLNHQIIEE